MQQRGITPQMVDIALRYGRRDYAPAAKRYQITDRALVGTPYEKQTDQLRGLTLIVYEDSRVGTAYWDFRLKKRGCRRRSRLIGDSQAREIWS
jgi:hypothetical protein